jgi:hypothetical protein
MRHLDPAAGEDSKRSGPVRMRVDRMTRRAIDGAFGGFANSLLALQLREIT